jgi:transglycosylase-like protein with SLT domain/LysM domain-containing protein
MKTYLKLLLIGISVGVFFSLETFTGFNRSDTVSEDFGILKDSAAIYSALEKSRVAYEIALTSNEEFDSPRVVVEQFESSARHLYKINRDTLEKHSEWKKDFVELGASVVQDYFTAVGAVPENSKVFTLASELNISYEKLERKTYSSNPGPVIAPYPTHIPLVKNAYVENCINFFQTDYRDSVYRWLDRTGKYFNIVRSTLREKNAPEELVYLAMIESGLNPKAFSRAGASGMWQFMPGTGTMYGLYYDGYTDDKRDIEKATDAAARHLKDLYYKLGDWYLALASYNAGIGRIYGAMKKSGSRDFWTLINYLPKETQNYVPQFIACALITMDPSAYGFENVEYSMMPLEYDRVVIKAQLSIPRIAELCGTDVRTIKELNTQLLKDTTPVFDEGYLIKIPKGSYQTFVENYREADDFEKYGFDPAFEGSEGGGPLIVDSYSYYRLRDYQVEDSRKIMSKSNREPLLHAIKADESFYTIAEQYAVRPSDIRIWNQISYGKYPKPGDTISVWLTPDKYNLFSSK